eukprot:Ihof_evm2s365 gene=Ihof_evmTU2s365
MGAQQGKFNYNVGECMRPQDILNGQLSAVYKARSAEREGQVHEETLFVFTVTSGVPLPSPVENGVVNALQKLKVLRHPSILKFYGGHMFGGATYVVTEAVVPLSLVLNTISPWQALLGLYNIIKAVVFLHNSCHLSHNNIGLHAVYVNARDGAWKLGGFEFCRTQQETTEAFLKETKIYRPECNRTEETGNQSIHMTDTKALCRLLTYIQSNCFDDNQQRVEWASLLDNLKMIGNDPTTSLAAMINNQSFTTNELVALIDFIRNLDLKSNQDKQVFFSGLLDKVRQLPCDVFVEAVLPHVLTPRVLLEPYMAWGGFLPSLLTPKKDNQEGSQGEDVQGIIASDLFVKRVLPYILQLYKNRSHSVRMVLLAHHKCYAPSLSLKMLQRHFLPEILIGLDDTSDILFATIEALLDILHQFGDMEILKKLKPGEKPPQLSAKISEVIGELVFYGDPATKGKTLPLIFELMRFDAAQEKLNGLTDQLKLPMTFLVHLLRAGNVAIKCDVIKTILEYYRHFHVQVILNRFMPLIVPLVADGDSEVRQLARDVVSCVLEYTFNMADQGKETYTPFPAKILNISLPDHRKQIFTLSYPRSTTNMADDDISRRLSSSGSSPNISRDRVPAPSNNTFVEAADPSPEDLLKVRHSSTQSPLNDNDIHGRSKKSTFTQNWEDDESDPSIVVKIDLKAAEQKRQQRLAEMEKRKCERQRRLEEKKKEKEKKSQPSPVLAARNKFGFVTKEKAAKLKTDAAINDIFADMQPIYTRSGLIEKDLTEDPVLSSATSSTNGLIFAFANQLADLTETEDDMEPAVISCDGDIIQPEEDDDVNIHDVIEPSLQINPSDLQSFNTQSPLNPNLISDHSSSSKSRTALNSIYSKNPNFERFREQKKQAISTKSLPEIGKNHWRNRDDIVNASTSLDNGIEDSRDISKIGVGFKTTIDKRSNLVSCKVPVSTDGRLECANEETLLKENKSLGTNNIIDKEEDKMIDGVDSEK